MEDIVKEDFRELGRCDAEKLINSKEFFGMAPLDLVEYAYGLYEYFCEYLGFAPQEEGSTSTWEEEEEQGGSGIYAYKPASSVAGRVLLIQLADNLVKEFSDDFPVDPLKERYPAPLAYWFREGVPSALTFDWDWMATYWYDEIAEAYKYIREQWLHDLPELDWDNA